MPVQVSEEFLNAVVDYVEATGGAAVKAAETEEKVAEYGPAVVNKLIKLGFLHENGRDAAIAASADPLKVLGSLDKTAEEVVRRKAAEETDAMGAGAGDETPVNADATPATDNFGRRVSQEKQAAERRFVRTFMGNAG